MKEKLQKTEKKKKKKKKCTLFLDNLLSRVYRKALLRMMKTFINENNLVEKATTLTKRFNVKNLKSTDSKSVLCSTFVSSLTFIIITATTATTATTEEIDSKKDKAIDELLREEKLDLARFNKVLFKESEMEFIVERNLQEEALLIFSDDDRSEESLDDENVLEFHETLVFLIERVTILSENMQFIKSTLGLK